MKNILQFGLFYCALVFIVGCDSQPKLYPLNQDATILAFGDSLTFGTGAKPDNSYPSVLAGLTGYTVINSGVPGDTTADGVKRIEKALEKNPDLVILCLGGNDFLRKRNKLKIAQNLQKMIHTIRSSGAQVIMIAVPKPAIFLDDADLLIEFAEQHQVPILKDTLSDLLSDDNYKSDAIHLNQAGYEQLAVSVKDFLKQQGAL